MECFLEAFSDYSFPMSNDLEYWDKRFKAARLRLDLSFGMKDAGRLVGIILICVNSQNHHLTAYNTGTGVIPSYRGKQIVQSLYHHAIPIFQQLGITRCSLEVLQTNERAIKLYEKVGFTICNELKSYKGILSENQFIGIVDPCDFEQIALLKNPADMLYAWDFSNRAIEIGSAYMGYFIVKNNLGKIIGYFILNKNSGNIMQLDCVDISEPKNWILLFQGINSITNEIRIINIPTKRNQLLQSCFDLNLNNFANQYEMELLIP